jgi:hypothetical protein
MVRLSDSGQLANGTFQFSFLIGFTGGVAIAVVIYRVFLELRDWDCWEFPEWLHN